MKKLGSIQKTAAIAAVTLLLQLCGTANAGVEANRFTLAMKETRKSTAVQSGAKLEINRETSSPATKKPSVIQAALTPKIGEIDSNAAGGRTYRTRLNQEESLSRKWDSSDEFRMTFSVDRYWADRFHNEFRRSLIDADRNRGLIPQQTLGR